MVFHTCILHWNQITPLLLTLSLLPCSSVIQQLSVHFAIPSSHTDATYFDISHSLVVLF
jgi:hypothetical protein